METGRQEIETDSSTDLNCGHCFDCSTMTETYLNVCGGIVAWQYQWKNIPEKWYIAQTM